MTDSKSSSDLQVAKAKADSEAKPKPGSLIMSGMRSTHHMHIGNYFGALKQWLDLQAEYSGIYGVMNWHAMTSRYKEPHDVSRFAREIYAEWIAWGLDHEKNVIFIQSEVPELLELNMYFDADADVVGRARADLEGCRGGCQGDGYT